MKRAITVLLAGLLLMASALFASAPASAAPLSGPGIGSPSNPPLVGSSSGVGGVTQPRLIPGMYYQWHLQQPGTVVGGYKYMLVVATTEAEARAVSEKFLYTAGYPAWGGYKPTQGPIIWPIKKPGAVTAIRITPYPVSDIRPSVPRFKLIPPANSGYPILYCRNAVGCT
jgi:hypothetical protein